MDLAALVGTFKQERRNFSLKRLSGRRFHLVSAGHGTGRRRQRAAAGVFEHLAWLEYGLGPHDARAANFLDMAYRVGDVPVAGHQLDSLRALVLDGHRIGPQIPARFGIGLVVEKSRPHQYAYAACDALIHEMAGRFLPGGWLVVSLFHSGTIACSASSAQAAADEPVNT